MPTQVPSGFKLKRPLITNGGLISEVDSIAKDHLEELDKLLRSKIWPLHAPTNPPDPRRQESNRDQERKTGEGKSDPVADMLDRPLTPKRVPANTWAEDSLLHALISQSKEANPKTLTTLADYIENNAELYNLKFAFQTYASANWLGPDFNTKAVLDRHDAITDYLIAYAFVKKNLRDVDALANFLRTNKRGAQNVANYAIVSGARSLVDRDQLKVDGCNDDNGTFADSLRSSGILLSTGSFQSAVKMCIHDFVFNTDEAKIIDEAKVLKIPEDLKPLLITYMQNSPMKITKENANFHLPVFISQILQSRKGFTNPADSVPELADQEFDVQFQGDTSAVTSDISRSAILCAAQLFFGMVMGDELDVFGIVDYFTNKHLIRGGLEIRDRRLRSDLQMYVFFNQFIDLKENRVMSRTRPAERQMFYRKVFNEGQAEIPEDFIVNPDYKHMWNVLILESAKYLRRAQASPNPDSFVSRQNVMQAVEDLQYNLSTHCTGMVNVVTPLIDAELNFVLTRILMHSEVRQHLVHGGGGWGRVVETLYAGMKKVRPRASTFYSRARLGRDIIKSIADYDPAIFEGDKAFSDFISQVDAFITTQSILQKTMTDELEEAGPEEAWRAGGKGPDSLEETGALASPRAATTPGGGSDEWDF